MKRIHTYQNIIDHGTTSLNPDGSRTVTYKDLIGPGFTAYNSNGSMAYTYKNLFDKGYTTINPDGSISITYKNVLGRGYTTYNLDGSRAVTYKNLSDSGYSTYVLEDGQLGSEFDLEAHYADGGWISNSINRIVDELLRIDSEIEKNIKTLESECSRLTKEINEVRQAFYDQEVCINLLELLYSTMQHLTDTESMLYQERKRIREYIEDLED